MLVLAGWLVLNIKLELQQGVRSPGNDPVCGECCCACQGVARDGIVDDIAGKDNHHIGMGGLFKGRMVALVSLWSVSPVLR